jgi:hypothetical protein
MPYITSELRQKFDDSLAAMIAEVRNVEPDDRESVLDYLITMLVTISMRPTSGWRFKSLHRAAAVFDSAKMEFHRRMLGPYEDLAIEKNGDVEPYKEIEQLQMELELQHAVDLLTQSLKSNDWFDRVDAVGEELIVWSNKNEGQAASLPSHCCGFAVKIAYLSDAV